MVDKKFVKMQKSGYLHAYFLADIAIKLITQNASESSVMNSSLHSQESPVNPSLHSQTSPFLSRKRAFNPAWSTTEPVKKKECKMGVHDTKSGRSQVKTFCSSCDEACCPAHSVLLCLSCFTSKLSLTSNSVPDESPDESSDES